jgi:hypothetical protein
MSVQLVAVLIAAFIGAFLGIWISTMMGLQVPNTQLKGFEQELQDGKILLMLDVPAGRYDEIRVDHRAHPSRSGRPRATSPRVPAFP